MTGTNRNTPRQGDKPSLDALNRTIEGLEARIEGLMGSGKVDQRQRQPQRNDAQTSGIMQRKRALENVSLPGSGGGRSLADDVRARFNQSATGGPQHNVIQRPILKPSAPTQRETGDIAKALLGLREELKRDISDGLSREMATLRAEMRDIRANAGDDDVAASLRYDMEQLASSINALSTHASPADAETLRVEFDELRAMIDGLARQDTIRGVEEKLSRFNPEGLESEILNMAGRIDEIKAQLGGINSAPAIRQLEDKLYSIAEAVEAFGKHLPPDQVTLTNQLSELDQRLEDINRSIATGLQPSAQRADDGAMQLLEQRITELGQQIEHVMSPRQPDGMVQRLEALSAKIEELTSAQAAARLEERLEHLSALVEQAQTASIQQDLTPVLSDISRKIDALESGSVSSDLADRLDGLARRIEEIDVQPVHVSGDDAVFNRLESRLNDIAAHLNETVAQPASDVASLHNLEEQIANLSALISSPEQTNTGNSDLESRMNTLEDYMAASDEYIVEAARQAAEAVAEAYSRRGASASGGEAADGAHIAALANDLRTLEELTRSSEERNQRTFEALHETLVQIADRIDQIGTPSMSARAMPAAPSPSYDDRQAYSQTHATAVAQDTGQPYEAADELALEENMVLDAPEPRGETPAQAALQSEGKKSLLAGLGRKFRSGRNEETTAGARDLVEPSPPLDAHDALAPDMENQLLEPGSGAPDIQKILEKVRASQETDGSDDGEKADYIAAARRAAKAAAEQVEAAEKESKGRRAKKAAKNSAKAEKQPAEASKTRRPIVLAAGAALLALMSYQLVGPLLGGSDEPATVETAPPAGETTAPEQESMAPIAPEAGAPLASDADTNTAANPAIEPAMPADEIGDTADSETASMAEGVRDVTAPASVAPEAAVSPALPALDLPAEIGPKSLVDAANANDPLAVYEVGARYAEGRSVTADMSKAITLFERAAALGFAPAEYRLGNIYEKGAGVSKDLQKARDYYLDAAAKGNISAMHNLAVVFAVGIDGQPDYEQSAKWFTDAANHGVKDSQFNLAILYAKGSGVPQDLSESFKWFDVAARAGDKDAEQKRDEIAKALTPEQLKAAQTKSASWQQAPVDNKANDITLPDEWAGEKGTTSTVDMKRAVRNIQAILNNNGFDAGSPDGIMGAKTLGAIKAFQTSVGQEPTGEINEALVRELLARNK